MATSRAFFPLQERHGKDRIQTGIRTDKTARIQCILAKKPLAFLSRSAKIMVAILNENHEREDENACSVFSGLGYF